MDSAALTCRVRSAKAQICAHATALLYAMQILSENWQQYPAGFQSRERQRDQLRACDSDSDEPLNLLSEFVGDSKWSSVVRALKETLAEHQLPGHGQVTKATMKLQNFEDDPITVREPARRRRAQRAQAPARGRGRGRGSGGRGRGGASRGPRRPRAGNLSTSSSDRSESANDANSQDASESFRNNLPEAEQGGARVRSRDFRAAVANAAQNPNAGRAQRARKRPRRFDL